jgi:GR25 family glycosyltransferase involved in LPS biosynthesis
MKIGAVVIHSRSAARRAPFVTALSNFFKDTEVEFNIVDGVFTEKDFFDARVGLESKKISRGHAGCSLAHMNAMKLAIEKDYDYVYIFEDDVEIRVESDNTLKKWIENIKVDFDFLLMTNVGIYDKPSHDGRIHYKTAVDDLFKCSCVFGTQAYFARKEIINIMYNFHKKAIDADRIYNADGLHINCEKSPNVFLNIYTPQFTDKFFKHEGFAHSLIGY